MEPSHRPPVGPSLPAAAADETAAPEPQPNDYRRAAAHSDFIEIANGGNTTGAKKSDEITLTLPGAQ